MIQHQDSLALSGWAQPHDALSVVAKKADHIAYEKALSLQQAMERLASYANIPLAVGWSLGGLILMHAAAKGLIRPKALVILCSPIQFVKNEGFPYGMGAETFALFRENFFTHPEKTARRFHHLIADGDIHYTDIVTTLENGTRVEYEPWKRWLDILGAQRHDTLPLERLPRTLLIYGEADRIVSSAQGEYLYQRMPRSELHIIKGCAHAPHLHDAEHIREKIRHFIGREP